jgi:tetratricopeptide (TPR) repeat protein
MAAAVAAALLLGGIGLLPSLLRPAATDTGTSAGSKVDEAIPLKDVVAGHQQAARELLRANRGEEALSRLGQALAAIDRTTAADAERRALRLDVCRQRAALFRRLGKAAEAGDEDRQVRALLEAITDEQPDNQEAAGALAAMLLAEPAVRWTVLRPTEMKSAGGARLDLQPDGSVLASGPNAEVDVYTVSASGLPPAVSALRLEVLTHPTLPGRGPGRHPSGNFQLGEIALYKITSEGDGGAAALPITRGVADYAYEGELVERVFDDDPWTRWHVWGRTGQDHWALFHLKEPVAFAAGDRLLVRLEHSLRSSLTNLGRFRLSVSTDANALATEPLQAALRQAGLRGPAALGAGWFCHGDFGRALAPLGPAEKARPGSPLMDLLLALTQQELKHPEEARLLYERARKGLAQGPLDAAVAVLLPRAMVQIEGLGPAEAEVRAAALVEAHELAALTAAVEKNAANGGAYWDRAAWYVCRGRWKEAAKDRLDWLERSAKDWWQWMPPTGALLMAEDVDGYRQLCRRAAQKYQGTQSEADAEMTSKICLLLPGNREMTQSQVGIVEKVLDQGGGAPGWAPWGAATRALAAYRAGDHREAVRWSNKSLEIGPKAKPGSTDYSHACAAMALVVRAMAEHQLRREAEAHRSFAEAVALLPSELRMLVSRDRSLQLPIAFDPVHHDWLFAEVLCREAERLLFPNLAAFLEGKHQPADAEERLALAVACRARGLYRAAAGLYADAFAAAPKAGEGKAGHRYAAACCAVRACAAIHVAALPEPEKARWRRQALQWLQAEWAALTRTQRVGTPEERRDVPKVVQRWLDDPDLAAVRGPDAIALLPADERPGWTQLWAEVALRKAPVAEKPQ